MSESRTTDSVQRYLDALAGDQPAEPLIRELLDRAVRRLQLLCANMLYRKYERLTHPPLNIEKEEILSAVVERLLKAMRSIRPKTVREFFALANRHMRWELNDLARRLDQQPVFEELSECILSQPAASDRNWSVDCLKAIENLPEEEREILGLVNIQGLSHAEAAEVLGVATKTVQRRLQRAMLFLNKEFKESGIKRPGS